MKARGYQATGTDCVSRGTSGLQVFCDVLVGRGYAVFVIINSGLLDYVP